jgi:hypothetical protein
MIKRHRHRKGTLTEEQVLEIRWKAYEGQKLIHIAKYFGLGLADVSSIARGITWPDVGGPRTFKNYTQKVHDARKALLGEADDQPQANGAADHQPLSAA